MHPWRQVSVRMPENRQLERRRIAENARLLVWALWRSSDVPRPLAQPPGASTGVTFPQCFYFANLVVPCRALHTFVCARALSTDARRNYQREPNCESTYDRARRLECTPHSLNLIPPHSHHSFLNPCIVFFWQDGRSGWSFWTRWIAVVRPYAPITSIPSGSVHLYPPPSFEIVETSCDEDALSDAETEFCAFDRLCLK